MMMMMMAK